MRKFYLLVFVLISTQLFAQKQHFKGAANLAFQSTSLDKQFTDYQVIDFSTEQLTKEVLKRGYEDVFILELSDKHKWEIFLYENEIRAQDYSVKVNNEQGEFEVAPSSVRTYSGILNNSRGEIVSLTIGKDFIYGFITENETKYFIEPASYFDTKARKDQFVVYSEKDVIPSKDNKCGATDLAQHGHDHAHDHAHSDEVVSDRSAQACYEVELAIGSDFLMFQKYGDQAGVENHNIGIMNNVNTDYANFNEEIKFKIITQYISTCNSCDPWTASPDPSVLLGDFRNWGNGGGFGVSFDLGQVMTARDFTGSTIGLAYTAQVACTNSKYHTIQDFTTNASLIRVVVSHEIGHNFAYVHDGGGGFIMSPFVNNTTVWSGPSQATINNTIANKIGSCFQACVVAPPPPPGGGGPPLEVILTKNDETCFEYEDGEICLSISGGGGSYNVFWNVFGVTGECYSNLSPGTYSCTVVDNLFNSVEIDDIEIIGPESDLELELLSIISDDCDGQAPYSGSISVEAYGGAGPYLYGWTNNHLNAAPPGLATDEYYVTVFDSFGCERSFGPWFVPTGTPPEIEAMVTVGFSCNTNTATVEGVGSDVGGDFTYTWTTTDGNIVSGQNTIQAIVDQPGTYTLNVINNTEGCESSTSVEVIASADLPTADIQTPQSLDCQITSMVLDASNSSTGTEFTYAWTTSNGGSIISGDDTLNPEIGAAGTYTLTVTNTMNGCDATFSVVVMDNSQELEVTFDQPSDLTCNEPSIPFSVTANANNVSYSWSTPSGGAPTLINDNTIELNEAGDYILTVSNLDNGCTFSTTIPVEDNRIDPISDPGVGGVIGCSQNGFFLDGSNSSTGSNFSYQWTTVDGNIIGDPTSLNPEIDQDGTYILVVTDNDNGCEASSSTFVTEDTTAPDPSLSANGSIDCETNEVNVFAQDLANLNTTYIWTTQDGSIVFGADTDQIVVNAGGTYQVEMINQTNGCSSIATIEVIEDANFPIASVVDPNELDCVNTTTSLDGSNSSTGNNFTYEWTGPGIVSGADGLSPVINLAGAYTFTVTDQSNGCETTVGVNVSEDVLTPILSLSTMPESAPMTADGTVSVSTSNTPNATYEWTDANGMVVGTTAMVTGLAPGLYCVVVTNTDNGCFQDNCIEVLAGADPCANSNLQVELESGVLTCAISEIDLVASDFGGQGTSSYVWSDGSTGSVLTVSQAGPYSVIVTDENGCTVEGSVEILEDSTIPIASTSQTGETTLGANDGTASVSTLDDLLFYEYAWTNASGMLVGTTETISNLAPGEYCVVVTNTNNGCTTESCLTILGGSDPCAVGIALNIASVTDQTTINCLQELITLEAIINGGEEPYEYLWNTGSTNTTLEVTEGGEYSLIITDANGCIATDIFIVEDQTNTPQFGLIGTNETSLGAADGSISLDVLETGVTYQWTNSDGMVIGTDSNLDNLAPGEYCLEVTFVETGCVTNECYTVLPGGDPCAEGPIVIINGFDDLIITCVNPTISLEAEGSGGSGTLTYSWNLNDSDGAILEVMEPGEYTVIVTDENGCTDDASFVVDANTDLPTIEITSTPETIGGAADGTVSIVANASTTVEWTDADGNVISTDATVTGLEPGEYCVAVTNLFNGCINEECVEVFEGGDPCVDFSIDAQTFAILCNGDSNGSADIEVTGGTGPFNVSLNGLQITSFTGNTFTTPATLSAGSTIVQIEDANGCMVDLELEIDEPEQIEVVVDASSETALGAADGTASAVGSGGTGSYTYEWSNGQMTGEIDGLVAAEYCVTVTDENGCSTESCIDVGQGADPCENFDVILSTEDVLCNGELTGLAGVEVLGSTGDLEITWSNGMTGSNIDGLPAGIYSIQVSDENDCAFIGEFAIEEPSPIVVNVTATNESTLGAADGSASSEVSGGTGVYTYSWSGSNNFASFSPDIVALESATYCLVVTDENGCESEEFCVEIDAGADPCEEFDATISTSDLLCNGDNSGEAVVEILNGTLPYTYDWGTGNSSTSTNSGLPAGTILVVVTDANGCQVALDAEINEPTQLQVNVTNVTAETDTGASDGTLEIEIAGGVLPYELVWDNGATTEEQNDLACGNYSVTVIDGNGCTVETTATVPCQDLDCETLQADIQINPVSCFGDTDGQIEIFPSGGTGPYIVTLNSGQSGTSINNLPASLYVVLVEDANGCLFTEEVTVPSPAALESQTFGENGLCGAMAIAQVVPFGGTAPYGVEWSNGSTTNVITGLESGTYTVTVTDANNCSTTDAIEVETIFNPINFEVQTGNVFCNGGTNGFINVEVLDGQGPYTYQWSNGATTSELFDLPAGEYSLLITDGNGCEYALSRSIIEPNPIQLDYAVSQGGTSTTFDVTLNVSGGSAPYIYDWSDGSNSIVNTGMQVGSYTVTIIDDRGCEQTFDVIIDGALTGLDGLDILESFKVYPNPTKDQIYFVAELSEYSKLNISVFNALGQLIFQDKVEGLSIKKEVNLNEQPIGTYFLQVGNDRGQIVEKILKID